MSDFTDADAIKAGRMVASGSTWADVVQELYPDTEYPELLADLTCERFRAWYRQQTPQRLMEVFCVSDTEKLQKVYLVEVSDELLEGWFPFAVFLHRESAEDYAEALRGKDDGVLCFARVSELKVVDA